MQGRGVAGLGVDCSYISLSDMVRYYCLCGFMAGSEDSIWKHIDQQGPPHDIREAGDKSVWTGPAEIPYTRPTPGLNPGCSITASKAAAANKGRRTDAGGLGTDDSPAGGKRGAGDIGKIDLTHYALGDGKDGPKARTDMGTDGIFTYKWHSSLLFVISFLFFSIQHHSIIIFSITIFSIIFSIMDNKSKILSESLDG